MKKLYFDKLFALLAREAKNAAITFYMDNDSTIYIYNPYRIMKLSGNTYANYVDGVKNWIPELSELLQYRGSCARVYYPGIKQTKTIQITGGVLDYIHMQTAAVPAVDTNIITHSRELYRRYIATDQNIIAVDDNMHKTIIDMFQSADWPYTLYAAGNTDPVQYRSGTICIYVLPIMTTGNESIVRYLKSIYCPEVIAA